jgi:chromosome partitioning protein
MARGESTDLRANEAREFADFAEAIGAVEHDYEFVVIDTPASDSYLMRLAHSLADTLISPLNDSYIDVDVFSRVNHDRKQRGAVAHYADLVLEARRKRRLVDNGVIDWVMVRNRMASLANNNAKQIAVSIAKLGAELRFRVAEGFHDRVIFRELFPIGLTALDAIEQGAQKGALTASQQGARQEIENLVEALQLPTRTPGLEHLDARRLWHARVSDFYRGLGAAASDFS